MTQTDVAALSVAARSQYGLPDGALWIAPLHLAENATYSIASGRRERPYAVLRVYRAGRHSRNRIHSELTWVEALAAAGVRTARPHRSLAGELTGSVRRTDGTLAHFAVLDYLPSDPEFADIPETLFSLGAVAGTLHSHARTWAEPVFFERPTWDAEGTLTETTSWGRWLSTDMPASTRRLLLEARARILAELPPVAGVHRLLQHADLKPGNSIWSNGHLYVIDFDDSGYSWPLFDLAASLTGMENLPETPALVDAWLRGYTTTSAIADAEVAMVPALLMQRRLMILGWLFAHPEGHPGMERGAVLADTADMARRFLDEALLSTPTI